MKTTQLLKSRMQQTELRVRGGEQASYPRRNKEGNKKLTEILIMKFSHFAIDTIDWY